VGVEGEDETLEQISLVLDVIKFHCAECEFSIPFESGFQLKYALVRAPRLQLEITSKRRWSFSLDVLHGIWILLINEFQS
jgi:hypothetical protein